MRYLKCKAAGSSSSGAAEMFLRLLKG